MERWQILLSRRSCRKTATRRLSCWSWITITRWGDLSLSTCPSCLASSLHTRGCWMSPAHNIQNSESAFVADILYWIKIFSHSAFSSASSAVDNANYFHCTGDVDDDRDVQQNHLQAVLIEITMDWMKNLLRCSSHSKIIVAYRAVSQFAEAQLLLCSDSESNLFITKLKCLLLNIHSSSFFQWRWMMCCDTRDKSARLWHLELWRRRQFGGISSWPLG